MQKIFLSLFNVFLLINNYSNVLTCQKSTRKKIWDNTQESYINPTTQIYQPNLNNQDEIINPKIKKLFNTIVHQQNKSKQIVIENNKDDYKCFYCLEKQNNENDLIKLAIKNKNKVPAGIECYLCSGCLLSKPLITEKDPIDRSLPMITTLDNVDI